MNPLLRIGLMVQIQVSKGDKERVSADDRLKEEDDRFAYNLHAMCVLSVLQCGAAMGFSHTRRKRAEGLKFPRPARKRR